MNLKTLYLKQAFSVSGRHSLAGRQLYDQFCKISKECLLGHIVLPDEDLAYFSHPNYVRHRIKDDILPANLVKALEPNLIYVEGGLFADANFKEGQWRIPQSLGEELVAQGAVMIIADVDYNQLCSYKTSYRGIFDFIRVSIDYGAEDKDSPVYGIDRTTNQREIICKPEHMVFSEWLSPIYDGISEVVVNGPVRLAGIDHEPLASGKRETIGVLQNDVWVEEHDSCVFASVAHYGFGYIVFITGYVSHDQLLKRCPDNTKWLTNIGEFLVADASSDKSRTLSPFRSSYKSFLDKEPVSEIPAIKRSQSDAIKIFFCYAHEDEALVNETKAHLKSLQREGLAETWHDRNISPGAERKTEIDKHLKASQIILLMISSDFINSDYCYETEMKQILQRHKSGETRVIPVILRPCDWHYTLFGELQAFPTDGKPITSKDWQDHDEALYEVTMSLRKVIEEIHHSAS